MDNGFPMFRALGEAARAELNTLRTSLKTQERTAWKIGRAHCLALIDDKARTKAKLLKKLAEIKAQRAKAEIDMKDFEREMLRGSR